MSEADRTAYAERHPTVTAAITAYFRPGRTIDDLFRECLELVIAGATATAG